MCYYFIAFWTLISVLSYEYCQSNRLFTASANLWLGAVENIQIESDFNIQSSVKVQRFRQQPLFGPRSCGPSSRLGTVWYSDWAGRTAPPGESAAGSGPQNCSPGPVGNAWPKVSECGPGTGSRRYPSARPGKSGRKPRRLPGCSQNDVWHEGNAETPPDPRSAQWPADKHRWGWFTKENKNVLYFYECVKQTKSTRGVYLHLFLVLRVTLYWRFPNTSGRSVDVTLAPGETEKLRN